MLRRDPTDPYLGTLEGAVGLLVVTVLNLLSFMILVDREPSRITTNSVTNTRGIACDVGSLSQGLYIVPNNTCFPIDFVLQAFLPVFFVPILMWLGYALAGHSMFGTLLATWKGTDWWISILFLLVIYISVWVLDIILIPGWGVDPSPGSTSSFNITFLLVFTVHALLVASPLWIYTLPLLPDWTGERFLSRTREREGLEKFINSNWRYARLVTTLVLTGVVGTTLPFVFNDGNPTPWYVVGIVGSVTIGPLGIVWFLMRRIREAEKKLQQT